MLKKALALSALAVATLAFTACSDPIVPYQDPISQYPQVHTEAYSLQGKVRVEQPIATRVGAGQLKVQVPIRNLSDSELPIDYMYYFVGRNGAKSEGPSARMFLRIPRKGIEYIEFTSMTPVDDFRVEIFYAK